MLEGDRRILFPQVFEGSSPVESRLAPRSSRSPLHRKFDEVLDLLLKFRSLLRSHLGFPDRTTCITSLSQKSISSLQSDCPRPPRREARLSVRATAGQSAFRDNSFDPWHLRQKTHCGCGQPPEYSESAEIGCASAGTPISVPASCRTCCLRVP
jgi:hypothetical protein